MRTYQPSRRMRIKNVLLLVLFACTIISISAVATSRTGNELPADEPNNMTQGAPGPVKSRSGKGVDGALLALVGLLAIVFVLLAVTIKLRDKESSRKAHQLDIYEKADMYMAQRKINEKMWALERAASLDEEGKI